MKFLRMAILAAALIALVVVAVACEAQDPALAPPDDGTPTPTPAPLISGSIQAEDQTSDGTTITIAYTHISGSPGFVVVHRDVEEAPGPIVGYEPIAPGTTENVVVTLDEPVGSGDYWVMLHVDAEANGVLDFPGPDEPVYDEREHPVMAPVALTVG